MVAPFGQWPDFMTPSSPEQPQSLIGRRPAQERAGEGVGLFSLLRMLERHAQGKPRIGRNARLRDTLVRLGQDPFLSFPTQDITRVDSSVSPPVLRAAFLGFYGAFGALPLNWTEEVRRWFENGDESFTAFTDIFTARFQELFFRAWSDARPITQFDHPENRFMSYLLALEGSGTPAFRNRDSLPDDVKARLAPLAIGRVKSPVRLQQMLGLTFRKKIYVEEMVLSWLEFEADTCSLLGLQCSELGKNLHIGRGEHSCSEKIRLHFYMSDIEDYNRMLPGSADHRQLSDIVFWYLGQRFEIEVVLWLPEPELRPMVLGETGQLGWMAYLAPDESQPDQTVRATSYRLRPHWENSQDDILRLV